MPELSVDLSKVCDMVVAFNFVVVVVVIFFCFLLLLNDFPGEFTLIFCYKKQNKKK